MSVSSKTGATEDLLGLDDYTEFNSAPDGSPENDYHHTEPEDGNSTNLSTSPVHSVNFEEFQNDIPSALSKSTITETPSFTTYTGLPHINYSLYSLPDFKPDPEDITIYTTKDKKYAGSQRLKQLILSQATLPPKPIIQIMGIMSNHRLFWFKMNIMALICGEKSRPWRYSEMIQPSKLGLPSQQDKIPDTGEIEGLDELIQAYLMDSDPKKQLVLERSVVNWNTALLEGQIKALIKTTKFPGLIRVAFPALHSKIIIRPPDKTYRILASMQSLFKEVKEYKVRICWPYADIASGRDRVCAVQTEGSWWEEWKDVIRYAVVERRHWDKWITNEDKLESLMAPKRPDGKDLVWGLRGPAGPENGVIIR